MSPVERRGSTRRVVCKRVMVQAATGQFAAAGVTRNLSGRGVLLSLDADIAVGSSVEVMFDMPTLVGDNSYPVRCLGRVVRVEPGKAQRSVAVAFERVDILGQA